jgi:hypothetical protein
VGSNTPRDNWHKQCSGATRESAMRLKNLILSS